MFKKSGLWVVFLLIQGLIGVAADDALVPFSIQLQWVTQAQFAGYFVAAELGFYEEEGLDVTILVGAADTIPVEVVAGGEAEFGVTWVPKVLKASEGGANLVNIAQIFRRSGSVELSLADTGIESIDDLLGKRVGYWGNDNEFELFAALRTAGIDIDDPEQISLVPQPFHTGPLLNGELDAAQALIYNGYAAILALINPASGEQFTVDDIKVIDFNDIGTAMLQDHLFVDGDWLTRDGNEALAVALLKATFRGWIYCRDNPGACVEVLLAINPDLGESHQTWQMNEVNKLIWPVPDGIGIMDEELWDQTLSLSLTEGAIESVPDNAWRSDLAQTALQALQADMPTINVTGADWMALRVDVRKDGQ